MKRQIKIHLKTEEDYKNRYNDEILSYELSNYIIEETKGLKLSDKFEFIVTADFTIQDQDKLVNMIRNCFGTDVSESLNMSKKQSIANSLILLIGIIFLLLYYVIVPKFISELTLILGWVFIGEAICNFLYKGVENRLNVKRKKQIIDAKVIFK